MVLRRLPSEGQTRYTDASFPLIFVELTRTPNYKRHHYFASGEGQILSVNGKEEKEEGGVSSYSRVSSKMLREEEKIIINCFECLV